MDLINDFDFINDVALYLHAKNQPLGWFVSKTGWVKFVPGVSRERLPGYVVLEIDPNDKLNRFSMSTWPLTLKGKHGLQIHIAYHFYPEKYDLAYDQIGRSPYDPVEYQRFFGGINLKEWFVNVKKIQEENE